MSFVPIITKHLPFRYQKIRFSQIESHWHDSMEIMYLYHGNCSILVNGEKREIMQGELILTNMMTIHELWACEECKALVLQLPYLSLKEAMSNVCPGIEDRTFYINPHDHSHADAYQRLIDILLEMEKYNPALESHRLTMSSRYFDILRILYDNFQTDTEMSGNRSSDEKNMMEVIRYLNRHFKEKINRNLLGEIAGYSPLYISQLFQRQLDTTLTDYLNHIRLENAYKDLLYSDKSITYISEDNGFSSLKYFNKIFKDTYHMSPKDFRNMNMKASGSIGADASELRKKYGYDLVTEEEHAEKYAIEEFFKMFPESAECQELDFKTLPFRCPSVRKNLNIGMLEYMLLGNVQRNVLLLQKEIGFTYGVTTVLAELTDRWIDYISAIQELLDAELIPCLVLSVIGINQNTKNLIIQFLEECSDVYGLENLSKWRIAIHYGNGMTQEELKALLDILKEKFPSVTPGVRFDEEYRKSIEEFTYELSFYLFRVKNTDQIADVDTLYKYDMIAEYYGFEKSGKDYDSVEGAKQSLILFLKYYRYVNSISLGTASDHRFVKSVFSGECGCMTWRGNKKPLYHIISFLSKIENSKSNQLRNYLYGKKESRLWMLYLSGGNEKKAETYFRLSLSGISSVNYMGTISTINREYGNLKNAWENAGSPGYVSNELMDLLVQTSQPKRQMLTLEGRNNDVLEFFVPAGGISFLILDDRSVKRIV